MRPFVVLVFLFSFSVSFADRWQSYKVEEVATVELPAEPIEIEEEVWVSTGVSGHYVLSVDKFDTNVTEEDLDDFTLLIAGEGEYESLSFRDILYNGWRAQEFHWTSEDTRAWGRVVAIGPYLAVVRVEFDADKGAPHGAQRFLNSLKIEGLGSGPHKVVGPDFALFKSKPYGYGALHVGQPTVTSEAEGEAKGETAISRYGRRTYLTVSGALPIPAPENMSEEDLKVAASAMLGSMSKAWGMTNPKMRQLRTDVGYEFTVEGKVPAGYMRFVATVIDQLMYARAVIAPKPMMDNAQTRKWFEAFKF